MSVDINISNYEEYLLSYIDGELAPEERTALEAFLQQHPQQAKELEVYRAAILQPDREEVFEGKDALYRSATITLENYETFLLSYIDGELNETERTALEAFLKKHPHLEQELETWQSTRLQAGDTPVFENKEMLYRHADSLTPENYETYLLSYIDGELSPAEVSTLEQFMQLHPEAKASLELLERTRLMPDPALRMPGKSQLYRHNRRTIRPAYWWGAAAAVLAGCLFWLLPLQRDNNTSQPASVAVNKMQAPAGNQQSGAGVQPGDNPPSNGNLQAGAGNQLAADQSSTGRQPDANQPSITTQSPVLAQSQHQQHSGQQGNGSQAPAQQGKMLAANTPARRTEANNAAKANSAANTAANAGNKTSQPIVKTNDATAALNNNNTTALAQLPQSRAASAEVVQQHLEKGVQATMPPAEESVAAGSEPVLASNMSLPHSPAPAAEKIIATPAPEVRGELIMSVTSTGESKLLNGVANVAKFFSRKKHQR